MNNSRTIIKKTLLILAIIGLFLLSSYKVEQKPKKFTIDRFEKLGTFVDITLYAKDERSALQAADAAVYAIDKAEKIMSCFNQLSELSVVTEAAKNGPTEISPELYYILDKAIHYYNLSGKVFDPTIPPLVDMWKQAGKDNKLPTQEQIDLLLQNGIGAWHLKLKPAEIGLPAQLSIDNPNIKLNINAIAEGHIADLAAAEMKRMPGIYAGMINLGGEVVCFNNDKPTSYPTQPVAPTPIPDPSVPMPDQYMPETEYQPESSPYPDQLASSDSFEPIAFEIGIQDPFNVDSIASQANYNWLIKLTNQAVSTSGNYRQFVVIEGKQYSHIIDPRTGWPADSNPSVTIIAPTCADADALATVLSILNPEEGLALIESLPNTEAMIIRGTKEDNKIYRSSGFNEYLAE